MTTRSLRRTGLLFTVILVLGMAWLSRHSLLTQPSVFSVSQSISQTLGLPVMAAKRPDLLRVVSHGRFSEDNNPQGMPFILGQIYNPTEVSLHNPTINVIIVDKDESVLSRQQFSPTEWLATGPLLGAQHLSDFEIQLQETPAIGWGYRIQLAD